MNISKLPIPDNTHLVEVVTDENNKMNHCVYYINEHGNLIDHVKITEASALQVCALIPHMVIAHFTSHIIQEFDNIHLIFNRLSDDLKESEHKPSYDSLFSWQVSEEILHIIRMYSKLRHVHNYENTTEYHNEEHILSDFLNNHKQDQSDLKNIELLTMVKNWVL